MNFEKARFNMVEQQIRPWEVLDQRVLDLISATARDEFVPADYRGVAYSDTRIPLAHGEFMMAPKVEGRILQALEISGTDRGLEIGTGTGYLTMLLAQSARHITTVDLHDDFSQSAAKTLASRGITNVDFLTQDGCAELPSNSPYDFIAVTGALCSTSPALNNFQQQLAIGGRLFVVVGEAPTMEARLITRKSETIFSINALFETDLKYLIGAEAPARFNFD